MKDIEFLIGDHRRTQSWSTQQSNRRPVYLISPHGHLLPWPVHFDICVEEVLKWVYLTIRLLTRPLGIILNTPY